MKPTQMLLIALALALAPAPASAQQISMKQIAPGVGWYCSAERLYWTNDNGANWKDISPPVADGRIADIFFFNPSSGWVTVLANEDEPNPTSHLFSTSDGGVTWSRRTIDVRPTDFRGRLLAKNAIPGFVSQVVFVNLTHGWATVGYQKGVRSESLLVTSDRWRSWSQRDLPGVGNVQILPTSLDVGWLFGEGYGDMDCVKCLYVTRDGGHSWKQVAPGPASSANGNVLRLPTFEDASHGYLVVNSFYSLGGAGLIHALTLWATSDAGRTWKPDRSIENMDDDIWSKFLAFTVIGSDWIFAMSSDHRPVLTRIKQGARIDAKLKFAASASKYRQIGFRDDLSFVTPNQGWVVDKGLLSTTDGGATWTDITPGPKPHIIHPQSEPPR
jgi:photosystem II stability/assembly factor-like uncharacterized protein